MPPNVPRRYYSFRSFRSPTIFDASRGSPISPDAYQMLGPIAHCTIEITRCMSRLVSLGAAKAANGK